MATKRDLEAMQERRLEGARLLKRKVSQSEVARRLGVSRQTVNECLSRVTGIMPPENPHSD